jgi:hypothetical protein
MKLTFQSKVTLTTASPLRQILLTPVLKIAPGPVYRTSGTATAPSTPRMPGMLFFFFEPRKAVKYFTASACRLLMLSFCFLQLLLEILQRNLYHSEQSRRSGCHLRLKWVPHISRANGTVSRNGDWANDGLWTNWYAYFWHKY